MKNYSNKANIKTVVAIGKFDGVHVGHRRLIETAVRISRENNLKSLVYVVAPSGQSHILPGEERTRIFEDIGVDYYLSSELTEEFMAMTPERFVDEILVGKLNCECVVVGYNFRFGKGRCADAVNLKSICALRGIQTEIIDEVRLIGADLVERTVSSSLIRKFILNGDFKNANQYLGYKFYLSGTVCVGRQLGRTIGIPTANIVPGKDAPKIPNGVYATLCETKYGEFLSITNIGNNPTVKDGNPLTVETNIFNFSKDLYGEKIKITFLKRLRGEEKFPSLFALKAQIEKDKQYVLKKYGK